MITGELVTWSSHHQKGISKSTTEAEYVEATELIWLRNFLMEIGVGVDGPTKLFVDNQTVPQKN